MKSRLKNILLILTGLISSQTYTMQPTPKPTGALPPRPIKFAKVNKKEALRIAIMRNDLLAVQRNVIGLGELDDKDVERFEIAADYVRRLRLDPESDLNKTRLQIFNLLKGEIPGFYYRPLIGGVIDLDLIGMFTAAHDGLDDLAELVISDVDIDAKTLVPVSTPELSLRALGRVDSPSVSLCVDSPRLSVSILNFLTSDEFRATSTPAASEASTPASITEATPSMFGRAPRADGSPE